MKKALLLWSAVICALSSRPLHAAVTVNLSGPNGASTPVGTRIQWTASNGAADGKTLQYRWVIVQNGATVVYRDFSVTAATVSWAPVEEGAFTLTVTARDAANVGDQASTAVTNTAASLLSGGTPVVTATANPLVAIYSATCGSGTIRVFFAPTGIPLTSGTATPSKPCVAGKSVNFIIAGMTANTTYNLAHQVSSGFSFSAGPTLQFTTGVVPGSVPLPVAVVSGTLSATQPVILNSLIGPNIYPAAFNTAGQVIWYNYPGNGGATQLMRPMNGGTMVMARADVISEIDLLGNVVRETNITRMSEQLSKPPFNIINPAIPNRLADFNHEAIRLPNGYTATLSEMEQRANQGQGVVDVLGDLIIVLDQNYQLTWAWNSFTHLNLMRKATLTDGTCTTGQRGCPTLKLLVPPETTANDWTHANSLAYTGDGNLIMSMRNQDWVIKVDYENGAGSGNILWRFGNQGDFKLSSGQWFSHQHNASLTGNTFLLFDNANADEALFGGSRGLALTIDETTKTAAIQTDARLYRYSDVVGSAQRLTNGNHYFLAGFPVGGHSYGFEYPSTTGVINSIGTFDLASPSYRSFRMKDLYTP